MFARSLLEDIRRRGGIPLGDYMQRCNEHYYGTRNPFGADGDFITAPDISPLFGDILAAWVLHQWQQLGEPTDVNVLELGGGQGTLLRALQRHSRLLPRFAAAARWHLLETSPVLRALQQKAALLPCTWHTCLTTLPGDAPFIIIANEFFDALPVEQFTRLGGALQQRFVINDADDHLALHWRPVPEESTHLPVTENGIREDSPVSRAVFQQLLDRLSALKGCALLVDYGYTDEAGGDTLQAVSKHQYCPVLSAPGDVDLTAHVDFSALQSIANAHEQLRQELYSQRDFLITNGICQRVNSLLNNTTCAQQHSLLMQGFERLTSLSQMGTLFKCYLLKSF